MLRYEHIEYLNLLFGIPFLILALIVYNKWKQKALSIFGEEKLIKKLIPSYSAKRANTKNILIILIFILIIIGIANPQIGTKMEEVKREGVDLMIAIDLSNSMMAKLLLGEVDNNHIIINNTTSNLEIDYNDFQDVRKIISISSFTTKPIDQFIDIYSHYKLDITLSAKINKTIGE